MSSAAPTAASPGAFGNGSEIAGGRLVIGSFTGLVEGFSAAGPTRRLASARAPAAVSSEVSWTSSSDAWESRPGGVFATENAGQSWHEIYPEPAIAMVRLSANVGVLELGLAPDPCMCVTRKLWTDDDGATWQATDSIGTDFVGAAGVLYWWQGGDLHVISGFPPAGGGNRLDAGLAIALPDGTIVGAARTSSGFAFLVSNRVGGKHWDTDPRVLLADGTSVQTIRLPSAPPGEILADGIVSAGDTLTVTGEDYGADPVSMVTWTSADDGETWAVS